MTLRCYTKGELRLNNSGDFPNSAQRVETCPLCMLSCKCNSSSDRNPLTRHTLDF